MIITKECYKIVDADITVQNENESVWAIITLSKLVIGSFYRPPDKGIQPLVDLEMELILLFCIFLCNSCPFSVSPFLFCCLPVVYMFSSYCK